MPFDKFVDIDKIDDDRRNSVMKSIRTINVEELKRLADEIFHSPDDPWRQTLLELMRKIRARRSTTQTLGKASCFFTLAT